MAEPGKKRDVPWSLLAVMGFVMVMFLVLAVIFKQWAFVVLGVFGFAVGLAPLLSKE